MSDAISNIPDVVPLILAGLNQDFEFQNLNPEFEAEMLVNNERSDQHSDHTVKRRTSPSNVHVCSAASEGFTCRGCYRRSLGVSDPSVPPPTCPCPWLPARWGC